MAIAISASLTAVVALAALGVFLGLLLTGVLAWPGVLRETELPKELTYPIGVTAIMIGFAIVTWFLDAWFWFGILALMVLAAGSATYAVRILFLVFDGLQARRERFQRNMIGLIEKQAKEAAIRD